MQIGYLYDSSFLKHTLYGHPENAARLEAIVAYLQSTELLQTLRLLPFTVATKNEIAAVHDRTYIDGLERLSARGNGMMGLDYINKDTFHSASMAAGAAIAAARAVLSRQVQRAFALVRPPGHHAFAAHGEGFCLFNNIALAAAYTLGRMQDKPGTPLERVMIIDWDVHHGNGTESIFYSDPAVLYLSIHQSPLYPSTGRIADIGSGAGRGYNVNIPLPPGVGDQGYLEVFDSIVIPAATRYRPQLILVSAGYDCHWRDQLADMSMSLHGITAIMNKIVQLSESLCGGCLVVMLEGGYDLEVLRQGVYNTFKVLQNESPSAVNPIGSNIEEETSITAIIQKVRQLHNL